jgi:hypothetical protein
VKRVALVLAVLVYSGLDLSLAGMPGAFVFDPADSVESAHGTRADSARPLVAVQVPEGERPSTLSPPGSVPTGAAAARVRPQLRVVYRLPRAILGPPSSEDPH